MASRYSNQRLEMILILSFLGKRNGKLVRSAESLTVQHVCLFVLPLNDQGANELRLASPSGGNAIGQRTPCLGQSYPKSRLDLGAWPVVLKAIQNQKNFPLHSKMIIIQPWFSPEAVNLMNIQLLLLMSPPDVQAHLVKKQRESTVDHLRWWKQSYLRTIYIIYTSCNTREYSYVIKCLSSQMVNFLSYDCQGGFTSLG